MIKKRSNSVGNNITAEGLQYMDYIVKHSVVLTVRRYNVIVPTPAVYAIVKMIINKDRKGKQEKDLFSIQILYDHIKIIRGNMKN